MDNFLAISSVSSFQRQPCNLQQALTAIVLLPVVFSLNTGVLVSAADQGTCGPLNAGYTCAVGSPCCSTSSYCGTSDAYCGAGCQIPYSQVGACAADTRNGPSLAPGSDPAICSASQKCAGNKCCSQFGYCGTSGEYCHKGCLSQCRHTPGQITGFVFAALAGFAIICAVAFGINKLYRKHKAGKTVSQKNIYPVHRLFPKGIAEDENTVLDIVFCHGFAMGDLEEDAWRNTWRTRDEPGPVEYWAEEWLGNDLRGKARVFSLEYDGTVSSNLRKKGYNNDVSEISSNLLQCIFGDSYGIGQSNAVVLIGHSFGGLVIKNLVVDAQRDAHQPATNGYTKKRTQQCQNFLENIGGFVFYAVPHEGASNLEAYIRKYDNCYRPGWARDNSPELLSNIKIFSRKMEELSVSFDSFVKSYSARHDELIVYAFTEGLPMSEALGKIVEDGSAARCSGNNHFRMQTANHMQVCRPYTRSDESYRLLLSVLNLVIENRKYPFKRSQCGDDLEDLEEGKHTDLLSPLVKSTSIQMNRLRSRPSDVSPR